MEIPLSGTLGKDKFFQISPRDYPLIQKHTWWIQTSKKFYVRTSIHKKYIFLHRLLLKPTRDQEVDHINGDSLDYRRENLRICTHQQNRWNTSKRKDSTNKYRGIHFDKRSKLWRARIQANGIRHYSGYYKSEEAAANAFNLMAIAYHGKFAKINL